MDPQAQFLAWLSTTEHADRADLYAMYTKQPHFQESLHLHNAQWIPIFNYIEKYIHKHMMVLPDYEGLWVPVDLLLYIHKDDRPYEQRLNRYMDTCREAEMCITLDAKVVEKFQKGPLGTNFLHEVAYTLFEINELPNPPSMELPHLHVAGVLRDEKEPTIETHPSNKEQQLLLLEYPEGLQGELDKIEDGVGPSDVPTEEPTPDTIPEVEINNLGTVIFNGVEYVYMHDLEKALALRFDECIGMLAVKSEFPFDNEADQLSDKLLPLGDTVSATVALVCEEVVGHSHANVTEEEFQEVQKILMENNDPLPDEVFGTMLLPTVVEEERSSILIDTTAQQDIMEQNVLEMDSWASREGGKRTTTGVNAALAHYIGKLPVSDFVIVHKSQSPVGGYSLFGLKALSKILCLSTIGQGVNTIVMVNKVLATNTFSTGLRGNILAQVGLCHGEGTTDPEVITKALLTGQPPNAKRRKTSFVKKIQEN